jgi:hypothetical protein
MTADPERTAEKSGLTTKKIPTNAGVLFISSNEGSKRQKTVRPAELVEKENWV